MNARSLFVIALIAVIVALALPALSAQRERARRARCLQNLHEIQSAMTLYAADYRGWLPALSPLINGSRREGEKGFNRHAMLLLKLGYTREPGIFVCPSDKEDGNPLAPLSDDGSTGHARVRVGRADNLEWFNVSYVYVAGMTVRDRGDFLLLADEHWDSEGDCPAECNHDLDPFDNHGKDGRNVMFLDGHGAWLPGAQLNPAYESIQKHDANYRTRTVD